MNQRIVIHNHQLGGNSTRNDWADWNKMIYSDTHSVVLSLEENDDPELASFVLPWGTVPKKKKALYRVEMISLKWLAFCPQVNFVAAIDVYEDGEAGLLLCYNCESPSDS